MKEKSLPSGVVCAAVGGGMVVNMNTVLIVDDIATNRKILRVILSKALSNISIIEAEDGFAALNVINQNDVSVIILDIMMPKKDGIEVLTELKNVPKYEKIPVIMCSAVNELESIEKALSLGALDYFTKPLKEEEMRITLPLKVKNALKVYERERRINGLYEHVRTELLLAKQLQKSMFIGSAIYDSTVTWGKYIPCETIGGDLICNKQVNGELWFLIADVAGHGIASAMLSAMINSIFHMKVGNIKNPAVLLSDLNEYLGTIFTSTEFGLVSAFAGCIKGNTLCYANAGHPYPLFYHHKEASVEAIEVNGFLLGLFEKIEYQEYERTIDKDDAILCYTDGLFDKGENNGYSSWNLVHDFCRMNKNYFMDEIPEQMEEMIDHFRNIGNGPFIDDVAVLAIKKL